MAIKPIVRMGTKKLSQASVSLGNFSRQELDILLKDMYDTMMHLHGIGIAAPQIGVYQRVVMFGFKDLKKHSGEEAIPFTVLVNPSYEPLSDETDEEWEGCLSLPDLRGLVTRYKKIRYRGHDQDGNLIEREVQGYHARVVQHECDHVNGFLYPQRMKDMKHFGFEDELRDNLASKKK